MIASNNTNKKPRNEVNLGAGTTSGPVPSFLSSFVGRRQELETIRALLQDEHIRLLTLTGPGGCGKTRLAAQAAEELALKFDEEVCWVELGGLADPHLVPHALVAALELADVSGSWSMERLIDVLKRRQLLLILDNCEHLLDICAKLAEQLLLSAPDLRILTTSRERLNVPGEVTWPVPGLAVPDPHQRHTVDEPAQHPSGYDAIQLFTERARSAQTSFELTADTIPAVVRICRQVDGIPLAIELAAASVRSFAVSEIAERLKTRLDLLTAGSRTAPTRQQSLRATLDWSYDLLSEPEKILFRRLSVFQGCFSLEAAESICADNRLTAKTQSQEPRLAPESILELLARLVDKSLITVERQPAARTVYRLLEMIEHYAREKLRAAGEANSLRDAHLHYYYQLAKTVEPKLKGPEQPMWVQHLQANHDNVRAALRWALSQRQASLSRHYSYIVQDMTACLFWFWNAANVFAEGRDWLEQAVALSSEPTEGPTHAAALWAAGSMAWLMGDFTAARSHLRASLTLSQRLEDTHGIAAALMQLSRVHLYQSQPNDALQLATESAAMFQELGEQHERGLALGVVSAALAANGEHDAARAFAEENLQIFRTIGDPFFIALALGDLGWVAYHHEALPAAVANLEEALELRRQINSNWLTAQTLSHLGEITRYQGAYERATSLLEESIVLAEESGARAWLATGSRHLGLIALRQGRHERAAAHLLDSLDHCSDLEQEGGIVLALEAIAAVAAEVGEWSLAFNLFGAAETLRETVGPPRTPAERDDLARLQAQLSPRLDDGPLVRAREEGRRLSLQQACGQAKQVTRLFRSGWVESAPVPHSLRIYALGPTQVMRGDRLLIPADWSYATPRELLFYLVSKPPLTKQEIGLVFWPDASPTQLRRNFRSALYHLRQALGGREWVQFENGRYAFNRALDYWCDVDAFQRHIDSAHQFQDAEPERALKALAAADRLYRGDFLEDVDRDAWALSRREELRQAYLDGLELWGRLLLARQEYEQAIERFHALLGQDNLMESAHRALMCAYARSGKRNRALRHYQDLVELLADELSILPTAETVALYEALQDGQAI